MQNVDPTEVAKFATLASQWWDPAGPLRPLHEINELRADFIAERARLGADTRVLDIGCGGGLLAEALARRGGAVTGIDLAAESLAVARAHAAEQGLAIDYRCVAAEQLAAEQPRSFDVVTCLEMLEHVPAPEQIVAAAALAARPGGAVFFSTINRNAKSFGLAIVGAEYVLGLLPRGSHEYQKLIQPAELARACRAARLVVRELAGLHYNPLLRSYSLGGNVDVNYFLYARKPEDA
jgi:2-polyprenyl-6-hydroxyphenyl methylase/3-demethylubiquinone-9 3-methyltransferase